MTYLRKIRAILRLRKNQNEPHTTFSVQVFAGILVPLVAYGIYTLVKTEHYAKKPHIIFILADDLGWADVSFHGSPQIPTPNLDALAADGIILNNYYTHPTCTASRGALMTGLYSIRYGLQHIPIQPGQPFGLDLNYTLLPQHLKRLGYGTHLIGKWHLGCYREEYTPNRRGFDSFYGYYYGHKDYFNHMLLSEHDENISGLDLWNGSTPALDGDGRYSTDLFADKAVGLIRSLDKSKPHFLYLSHQAVHSGNYDNYLQAPKRNTDKFAYIGEENRTLFAGMLDSLDEAVGRTVEALREAGMLEDSVIVFSSDNGGKAWGLFSNRGNNWPLRGSKGSPWEGASRAAAFVWSPRLAEKRRVSNQLMQITDWLPTLYGLAGGTVSDLGQLDGHDMWRVLSNDEPSPRSTMVYNIDPLFRYGAVRKGRFKIVLGRPKFGGSDRIPLPGHQRPQQDLDVLTEHSTSAQALRALYGTDDLGLPRNWRTNATITCPDKTCADDTHFESQDNVFLFDLHDDPCECNNLASTHKEVLESLNKTLEEFKAQAAFPLHPPTDPASYPSNHNGTWAPWID